MSFGHRGLVAACTSVMADRCPTASANTWTRAFADRPSATARGVVPMSATLSHLTGLAFDSRPAVNDGEGRHSFFSSTQPSLPVRKRAAGATGSTSFTCACPSNMSNNRNQPSPLTGNDGAQGQTRRRRVAIAAAAAEIRRTRP